MGKKTEISWCHHTFSPWWGCQRVSPGCEHCYAETLAKRWGYDIWGSAKATPRRLFGAEHWREPLKWNADAAAAGERRRVFCASMSDVFESNPHGLDATRDQLWQLIRMTDHLDWLLLTKRPENIANMLPGGYWPNVWLGTSTEDQQRADERVPVLLGLRARVPVLFLSVEPQLGPVDLDRWLWTRLPLERWSAAALESGARECVQRSRSLDWIIVGGESGPRHRPFDEGWARALRDQCQSAGVAFHFKQIGGRTHAEGGCLLDGREWKEFPETAREVTRV